MGVQYFCSNNNCSYPGETHFQINFKSETIMDSNNIAFAYCPFCRKEMTPISEPVTGLDSKSYSNVCTDTGPAFMH